MTTTTSTPDSAHPFAARPAPGDDVITYVHGYSALASRRLADQADTLLLRPRRLQW